MLERFSRDRLARRARGRSSASSARIARDMPYQVHDVLEEMRDGQIEVGFVHKGLDEFMLRFTSAINRLVVAIVVVGGLIGSSLIGIFAKHGPHLLGRERHLGARLRRSPAFLGCSGIVWRSRPLAAVLPHGTTLGRTRPGRTASAQSGFGTVLRAKDNWRDA